MPSTLLVLRWACGLSQCYDCTVLHRCGLRQSSHGSRVGERPCMASRRGSEIITSLSDERGVGPQNEATFQRWISPWTAVAKICHLIRIPARGSRLSTMMICASRVSARSRKTLGPSKAKNRRDDFARSPDHLCKPPTASSLVSGVLLLNPSARVLLAAADCAVKMTVLAGWLETWNGWQVTCVRERTRCKSEIPGRK